MMDEMRKGMECRILTALWRAGRSLGVGKVTVTVRVDGWIGIWDCESATLGCRMRKVVISGRAIMVVLGIESTCVVLNVVFSMGCRVYTRRKKYT